MKWAEHADIDLDMIASRKHLRHTATNLDIAIGLAPPLGYPRTRNGIIDLQGNS